MCCVCCCICAVLGAVITFLVWCIVAVSSNDHLQYSECAYVADVWWTVTIMLIVQACNMCIIPCIFGWEQWKMAQDPEYARTMRIPLQMLHVTLLSGEAFFISIFGNLAWKGISAACLEQVPSDLWVIFQIVVVLWTISCVACTCTWCVLLAMLAGVIDEPGQAPAEPNYENNPENEPFVEQNPSASGAAS